MRKGGGNGQLCWVGGWHSALNAEYFYHIPLIKYVYKSVKFYPKNDPKLKSKFWWF